jgi:hypothetical protein
VSANFETNRSVTRGVRNRRWAPLSLLCLAFPLTFDPLHQSNQSVDALIRGEDAFSYLSNTDNKEK